MGGGRLYSLDALRGFAAFGVAFLTHFFHVGGVRNAGPLYPVFEWVYLYGETFVDLFFVLSGFVIYHACASQDVRSFAIRRLARLYPLHLATFFVAAALLFVGRTVYGTELLGYDGSIPSALQHLALVNGLGAQHSHSFNAPAWSISVEVACYALFIATVRSRHYSLVALAFVAVGVSNVTGMPLSRGLIGFFIGTLLCRHYATFESIPTGLLSMPVLCLFLFGYLPPELRPIFASFTAWPALVLLVLRQPLADALAAKPLRWLGDRSYGIYLIHTPVQLGLLLANGATFYVRESWLAVFVASIVLTVGLADVSYRWLETPARRFASSRLRPATALATQ